MVELQQIDKLVRAGNETGNPVTTIEMLPDGSVAVTFLEGLERAYRQEALAGAGNPAVKKSEQNPAVSPEINVDILAKQKNTNEVIDVADIHLEHRTINTDKAKAEVEVSANPAAINELAQQMMAAPAPAQLDNKPVAGGLANPDVQILEQMLAISQPSPVTQLATPTEATSIPIQPQEVIIQGANAQVTVEKDEITKKPILAVNFEPESVNFELLKEQLNIMAADGSLGANGQKLVDDALKLIAVKYPELILPQQENTIIIQPQPELQASASAEERGHEGRRKPEMHASAQTNIETQSVKMEQPLMQASSEMIR
jgi:hypothetical protein